MKEKNKEKSKDLAIKYKAQDYSYSITKIFGEPSNAERFILNETILRIEFKVTLIEFGESFILSDLEGIEAKIDKMIQTKLNKLYSSDSKKVPLPIKYDENFSGTLSLRISPTMHKQLYIESKVGDISMNKLIEMKLKQSS